MEEVSGIVERLSESDRHYDGLAPPPTCGNRIPWKVRRIPARITYGRAQSPWPGNTEKRSRAMRAPIRSPRFRPVGAGG